MSTAHNSAVFEKLTDWKAHGRDERIRFNYGFNVIGTQEPYFFVTADVQRLERRVWVNSGGGCMHETLIAYFPELADLVPWHLFSVAHGPLHYEANAIFWWEHAIGVRKFGPYDYLAPGTPPEAEGLRRFYATIGPLLPEEEMFSLDLTTGEVAERLRARLPKLFAAFAATMEKHGLLDLKDKAETYHANVTAQMVKEEDS